MSELEWEQATVIRLSKMADYGIVIVTQLVRADGQQKSASDVAAETQIPQPTVSKIMKQLVRAGVLNSVRGVNGGYDLAKPKDRITVADVIEALDGPIALTSCMDADDESCGIEALCLARPNWQRINDAIRDALDSITIEEMSQTIPPAFMAAPADEADKVGAL